MPDDTDKFICINGREELISYYGPVPVKGAVISLDDGRFLYVKDALYKARMAANSVIVSHIVITARFV